MDEKLIFYIIIGLLIYFFILGYKNGNLKDDFSKNHIIGLLFFMVSSILMWLGLIWMRNPGELIFEEQDKMSFAFSVVIGVLTWGRLIYTVYD